MPKRTAGLSLAVRLGRSYRGLVQTGLTNSIAGVYGDDRETVRLLAERVAPELAG